MYMRQLALVAFGFSLLLAAPAAAGERVQGMPSYIKAKAVSPTYGFSLIPKKLVEKFGHKEIVLSLELAPSFNLPGVELRATYKHGRTNFAYSKALRAFMKSLNLTKKDFRPFERYLRGQITKARKDLVPFIALLATYLQTGIAPEFTLDVEGDLSHSS